MSATAPPATASLQLILKGKIGQTVILGLIIGLVYLHIADDLTGVQDREGSLFFLAVQGEWLGPGGVGGGGGPNRDMRATEGWVRGPGEGEWGEGRQDVRGERVGPERVGLGYKEHARGVGERVPPLPHSPFMPIHSFTPPFVLTHVTHVTRSSPLCTLSQITRSPHPTLRTPFSLILSSPVPPFAPSCPPPKACLAVSWAC